MRLIDADAFCALLREVSTRQHYETLLTNKDKYPTVADVIEEICCDIDGTSLNGFDNAPTVVKIDINDVEYKAYCKGLEDGKKIARPQGKWIDFSGLFYECDQCQFKTVLSGNFCPKCGARMENNDGKKDKL